jgi:hypothetical protein
LPHPPVTSEVFQANAEGEDHQVVLTGDRI